MIAFLRKLLDWFLADYEQPVKQKQYLYRYKHRIFWCDLQTIKRLNDALAMANSEERYKRVLSPESERYKKRD